MGPRPRHGGPWHLRDTATPPSEAGHPILPSPQGPLPQLGHPATCPTQGPAPGPHPACRSTPGQALSPSPCPQGPQGGDDTDLRVPVDPAAAGPPGGTLRQSTAQCTTLGRGGQCDPQPVTCPPLTRPHSRTTPPLAQTPDPAPIHPGPQRSGTSLTSSPGVGAWLHAATWAPPGGQGRGRLGDEGGSGGRGTRGYRSASGRRREACRLPASAWHRAQTYF